MLVSCRHFVTRLLAQYARLRHREHGRMDSVSLKNDPGRTR